MPNLLLVFLIWIAAMLLSTLCGLLAFRRLVKAFDDNVRLEATISAKEFRIRKYSDQLRALSKVVSLNKELNFAMLDMWIKHDPIGAREALDNCGLEQIGLGVPHHEYFLHQ